MRPACNRAMRSLLHHLRLHAFLIVSLALATLTLAWDAGGLDLAVMRLLGDAGGFPLRHVPLLEVVLHDAVRHAATGLFLAALVMLAWGPGRWNGHARPASGWPWAWAWWPPWPRSTPSSA